MRPKGLFSYEILWRSADESQPTNISQTRRSVVIGPRFVWSSNSNTDKGSVLILQRKQYFTISGQVRGAERSRWT